jgi:uncharacterized protein with HEPN domain
MQHDDRLYFAHILETARKVQIKLAGKTKDQFDLDEDLQIIVTHLLQVIGEAARMVSAEGRAAYPAIPWAAIVGMRHRIVHDYFNIDEDRVWETATAELAPLIEALSAAQSRRS